MVTQYLSKWTDLNINFMAGKILTLASLALAKKHSNIRCTFSGKSGFRALPVAKNSLGQKI